MLIAWLRERTKPERWLLASAVAVIVLILGAFLRQQGEPGARNSTAVTSTIADSMMRPRQAEGPAQDVAQRLAILDNSLRAIEDGERESPRDRWDPAYVVERAGTDPAALFAWVRDNTVWIPYRGVLRGPVGVLMDRQGNSLDRALLLATLLRQAGHEVRLTHGEFSDEQAFALLPDLIARHADIRDEAPDDVILQSDIRQVAEQYGLDGAAIENRLALRQQATMRALETLEVRIADQTERLLASIARPDREHDWNQRLKRAGSALRDHWWVQREKGGAWIDMDVLGSSATPGWSTATATEFTAVDQLPPELHHQVVLRVIAERDEGGVLKEAPVLEHTLHPSQLFGKSVVLQFWPATWPNELHSDPNNALGFRAAALEQDAWSVALVTGGDVAAQAVLRATGEATDPAAGNPWAALGGGLSGLRSRDRQQAAGSASRQLTAVWIEYEIRTPGDSPRTIRRTVLDLPGPAYRSRTHTEALGLSESQRLERSLSLMMRTEILPIAAKLAPEFVTHLSARSMLANRELLRAIWQVDVLQMEGSEIGKMLADASDGLTPLYALGLGRFAWASDEIFVDRTNILARHQYPVSLESGFALRDATDIVTNEVGVSLAAIDAFPIRVAQGVVDTNVETRFHAIMGPVAGTAEAFAASDGWLSISPEDRSAVLGLNLPDDALSGIRADLDRGYLVVAPRSAVRLKASEYLGWWRVNPATGDTLGVSANGWGQAMAERGVQYNVLVVMARQFAFDYAFCQAIPQVANQTVTFLQQYRDELPPWLPPLAQSKSAGAVYAENKKGCLIGAMIGLGVTATLPFLIASLKASYRAWMALGTRGAVRIPPRVVSGMPIKGEPASPAPASNPIKGEPASPAPSGNPPASPAPGGRGPYQADPFGRGLIADNPNSDATLLAGGRDKLVAAIDAADTAAASEYAARKAAGAGDQLAHDYSRDVWQQTFARNRPNYVGQRVGDKTVDMGLGQTQPDQGAMISGGRPPPVEIQVRHGPPAPSPGTKNLVGLGGAGPFYPIPWGD